MFRPTLERVRARRAGGDPARRVRRGRSAREPPPAAASSSELMGDLGFAWDKSGAQVGRRGRGARSEAAGRDRRGAHRRPQHHDVDEGGGQTGLLRRGLRGAAEHLADYTARLTDIFEKHGTRGTWYAHASVGCLHVRPVLNLRLEKDVQGDARHRRGGLRAWCATTRARIPASTATASCARNSTSRCSARGSCAPSRR